MPVASSAIQTGAGLIQSVAGLFSRNKAQNELKKLQNPQYVESKAISDYYNQALNRAMTSPYNSNFYNQAQRESQSATATGIGALGDRRSALAGVGALVASQQNAMNKAGVQAEQMQRQDFGQLGHAAQMKAGEDQKAFDVNQMMPFERRYSETMGRLQGANQLFNSGLSNTFSGIVGQPGPFGQQGGIGGLFKSNPSSSPQQSPYVSQGVGLADTGGPSVLNKISPASGIGYINPNSYYNF